MATDVIVPALESAAPATETSDVSLPSLDSATEAETPAVDTPITETTPEATTAESTDKTVDPVASAPITPKAIAEQLQELKKTNEPLAEEIHKQVKYSLEAQRLLKELAPDAKTISEAKEALSNRVAPEVQQQLDAVDKTDELLYRGDLKALSTNVFEDIKSELGDAAPARLTELTEALLEKVAVADGEGATRIQRSHFLDASMSSGLIESLNKLNGYIGSGDVRSAAALLKNIGTFFNGELNAKTAEATKREAAVKAQETQSTAAVEALRTDTEKQVSSLQSKVLGQLFLRPLLLNELKGLTPTQKTSLAEAIISETTLTLGRDSAYVDEMSSKYKAMKTSSQQKALLKTFEETLKARGKEVVERVAKRQFPHLFTPAVVKPAAPTTVNVNVNGVTRPAFVLAARPANLLRETVNFKGKDYFTKDLESMQLLSRGFVKGTKGTPVLVTWAKGKV